MVSPSIVRLSDGHRVVGEIDIAIIAWNNRVCQFGRLQKVRAYGHLQKSKRESVKFLIWGGRRILIFWHFVDVEWENQCVERSRVKAT